MDSTPFHLAGAVVSAGAYAPDLRGHPAAQQVPAEVLAEIRRARVELYCGQDAQAVADIRAAREQLRRCGAPLHAIALQALDVASWLARHGHTMQAEEALETALVRLETVPNPA
jgi:hypothetical protein